MQTAIMAYTRTKSQKVSGSSRMMSCFFCVLMAVACAAVSARAADEPAFREFSADVMTTERGRVTAGTIYVTQDKVRMEVPGAIIITRLDKDRSWVFIPEERLYLEQPIDRKLISSTSRETANETGRELLGTETVDGRPAKKYRVTYENGIGEAAILQWIGEGTAIPLRTAAVDGTWAVEYRNVRIGPLDAGLFEIPSGYEPVPMPVPPSGIPDDFGREDG